MTYPRIPAPLPGGGRGFVGSAGRGGPFFGTGPRGRQAPGRTPEEEREFRERQQQRRQFRPQPNTYSVRSAETAVTIRPDFGWQYGKQETGQQGNREKRQEEEEKEERRRERRRLPGGTGWKFGNRFFVIPLDLRPVFTPYLDELDELDDDDLETVLDLISDLVTAGVDALKIFLRIAARVAFNLSYLRPLYDLITVMAKVVETGTITLGDVATAGRALALLLASGGPVAALIRGQRPPLFIRNPSTLDKARAVFDAVAAEFGTSASELLQRLATEAIKASTSLRVGAALEAQAPGGNVLAGAPAPTVTSLDMQGFGNAV